MESASIRSGYYTTNTDTLGSEQQILCLYSTQPTETHLAVNKCRGSVVNIQYIDILGNEQVLCLYTTQPTQTHWAVNNCLMYIT
jgi:hypothetical protein